MEHGFRALKVIVISSRSCWEGGWIKKEVNIQRWTSEAYRGTTLPKITRKEYWSRIALIEGWLIKIERICRYKKIGFR